MENGCLLCQEQESPFLGSGDRRLYSGPCWRKSVRPWLQSSSNVLKFGPIHEFFRPVLQQLVLEAFTDREESDWEDHFLISYGGEHLRFIVRTLQYIEELAHGGALVILREDDANIRELAAIKYETVGFEAWNDLVQKLRLIYNEIELEKKIADAPQVDQASLRAWREADRELEKVSQRLVDLSRFIARLTQVDGALLITDRLRILGLGLSSRISQMCPRS